MSSHSQTITIQESFSNNMESSSNEALRQHIVGEMFNKLQQCSLLNSPRNNYTICPFPDILVGIDDGIQFPKLASIGPCHRGKHHLLPFEDHKIAFVGRFMRRTENLGRDLHFYVQELMQLKESAKKCYSEKFALPDDKEMVKMMMTDGCFMVELFREYEEYGEQITWPWHVPTLITDLLKLENQLPFFIIEKLFDCSNIGSSASTRPLPMLALRFLNLAFRCPSNMVNFQIQHPKHLLDLFRSSLLPSNPDPQARRSYHESIQNLKHLRNSGISIRKNKAQSLLEIDFRKLQIPPITLKIPPVAIDDLTSTVLVNCVAMEQCLLNQSKYFTGYACFVNCLINDSEDVGYLRSVGIIRRISLEDNYFISLLNTLAKNEDFSYRNCYLSRQIQDINTYYQSYWASIRRNLLPYNSIMLYCSIFQIVVGILGWQLAKN